MVFPICIRKSSLIISDWVHWNNWITSAMQGQSLSAAWPVREKDIDFLPYFFCSAMWLLTELDSQLRSQGTCSEAFGFLIKEVKLWELITNWRQRGRKEASAKKGEKENFLQGNKTLLDVVLQSSAVALSQQERSCSEKVSEHWNNFPWASS